MMNPSERKLVQALIDNALVEDVRDGDHTTLATINPALETEARFLAKATGIVAGLRVAEMVFKTISPHVTLNWTKHDGDKVFAGEYFGTVRGLAHTIITGERLALNILQRMSGIATATHAMVDAVGNHRTRVLDTRKTAPGLRVLDKMSVEMGGGVKHRMGLYDVVMIKDNHVTAAGGVTQAVKLVRDYLNRDPARRNIKIICEARTLSEVKELLAMDPIHRVLLDNMVTYDPKTDQVNTSMLREALRIINGRLATEASGNVTLRTVADIAKTEVDYISSGALTHSVTALDISLKIPSKAFASPKARL